MTELLNALVHSNEFILAIAVVLSVIGLIVVGWAAKQVQADARLSKYLTMWKLARDHAVDLMLTIRTENMDMTRVMVNGIEVNYEELAATSKERTGHELDARMCYVLDDLERFVFAKFGFKVELDQVIVRAEAWYQRLRLENNGLVMNDKDVPAVIEPIVESEAARASRSLAQRARREQERAAREAQAVAGNVVPDTGELAVIHKGESVLPTAVDPRSSDYIPN